MMFHAQHAAERHQTQTHSSIRSRSGWRQILGEKERHTPTPLPSAHREYDRGVTHVLLATDADSLAEDVFAALVEDGTTVSRIHSGADVRPVVTELEPDLVVLDLQIGNMGGVAASLDLRMEAEAGRVPETRILMLLDRDADEWIARQAKADAQLVKPVTSLSLRRAAKALLEPDS